MLVPHWWVWLSAAYIIVSFLWMLGLCIGVWMLYQKTMPVLREARTQVRRVSEQAKSVAVKASSTADIVHAQTQHLLGNAQSAGNQMTQSARALGAAFTGIMVAARVVNFIRRVI